MKILRALLYPISLLYGIVTYVRNKLYDWQWLPSWKFSVPVISVGNLSVGGTGKSPLIEYLASLLIKQGYKVAVLSRGYGRITSVFRYVECTSTVQEVGDEPLQIKNKFSVAVVGVDVDRVHGIKKILQDHPDTDVLLLDDAFQHRSVNPSLNILLTDYSNLYVKDTVLPTGNLREFSCGSKRADVVIVTKVPSVLSPIDTKRIASELSLLPHQQIFFSQIQHRGPYCFNDKAKNINLKELSSYSAFLITGIAQPSFFYYFIKNSYRNTFHYHFRDHHVYTPGEIEKILQEFKQYYSPKKVIITTEKDSYRMRNQAVAQLLSEVPVLYYAIETIFPKPYGENFDRLILSHVTSFRNR